MSHADPDARDLDVPLARAGAETDPSRAARGLPEPRTAAQPPYPSYEYRLDLERIRFSSYFSRLSAVTQVVPQGNVGPVLHNRLTHSIKVTAVAREIAVTLANDSGERGDAIRELGGIEPVVVQAAASAHDLGHPPFGHLGEHTLDRLARTRLDLPEGFEGNAQTFRILTGLDTNEHAENGLNLTAATRAAVLKYPWTRFAWREEREDFRESTPAERPRGIGDDPQDGAAKFSAYALHAAEMAEVRRAYPGLGPWQQTLECSVMDIADDIAYSVHDLDDFYRTGVLQQVAVSSELRSWLRNSAALARLALPELSRSGRTPGHALERLWRSVLAKDPWIADRDAFQSAVLRVSEELGDGLLATPYDGSTETDRAIATFTRSWIDRLQHAIIVDRDPGIRSGHIRLDTQAWHDVQVLKFVHSRFVLDRPDLATAQRGQGRVLEVLVSGFSAWLGDPIDAARAPRRLRESVEHAIDEYRALEHLPSELHGHEFTLSPDRLVRRATGRAIVDYVASLSDAQAASLARTISGALPVGLGEELTGTVL